MVRTRVGYAGGRKESPTYHSLGDHSETIQIDYDPTRISYGELLSIFWDSHSPTTRSWSRQYMSIIFYHNQEQERLAIETKALQESGLGQKVSTEIWPAPDFYLAEAYHQKYYLRNASAFWREFRDLYPQDEGFVNSTAAARVNGYLGGNGALEDLQAEIDTLGLSSERADELLATVAPRADPTEQCPVPAPQG